MPEIPKPADGLAPFRAVPKRRVEDLPEPPRARWAAVITAPSRERDANLHIRQARFWTFFPQRIVTVRHARKTTDALRAYLPGYVFVHLLPGQDWTIITELPNVAGFILGDRGPYPIPDRHIAALMVIAEPDGLVREPPKPPRLRVVFDPGDRVKITEGPFAAFPAVVIEGVDTDGLISVEAEVFSRPTPMRLPAGWVKRTA